MSQPNGGATPDMMSSQSRQLSTFYVADRLYGIDVMQVQEVTKPMPITTIRLAPAYVKGLINLRGQIATAIGLTELFGIADQSNTEQMNVVCKSDGTLLSFLVDRIGDVVEVTDADREPAPDNVQTEMRQFMDGVYKMDGKILSIISLEKITHSLNQEKQK